MEKEKFIPTVEERYYVDIYKLKNKSFFKETVEVAGPSIYGLEISIFCYRIRLYSADTVVLNDEPIKKDNGENVVIDGTSKTIGDYLVDSKLQDLRKALDDNQCYTLNNAINSGYLTILRDGEDIDDNTGFCYYGEPIKTK